MNETDRYGYCIANGFVAVKVELVNVVPTAWTIDAPGVVATPANPVSTPALGLLTTDHADPFQFRVRVVPLELVPTAHTSVALL